MKEFKAAGKEVRITQGQVFTRPEDSRDGEGYIYLGELKWKRENESMTDFVRRLIED